jgi:hypothetical protein
LVGGSGGAGHDGSPGRTGGGGGGAILIASDTRIDLPSPGEIRADGGGGASGTRNGGSGGAIRLVAPVVAGNGALRVFGGNPGGGLGRIRIDTLNRSAIQFSGNMQQVGTVGANLMVFQSPVPRLDIIDAAGTAIPEGSGPVLINLPFGSDSNRTVTVQAEGFDAQVPIRVVLTPASGLRVVYDTTIDNVASNPATTIGKVVVPVNNTTLVNTWTR